MRRNILFFIIIIIGIVLPSVAGAVDWLPIVPCGVGDGDPCSPCDLFKTFHNVIDLVLYGVTGPVAAFMIVVAGGMMLLSAGSVKMYSQGLHILQNTLIGVAIILVSWVFTNFIIKSLGGGNRYDSWNEFSCPAGLASIVNIETEFPKGNPPTTMSSAEVITRQTATQQAVCSDPSSLAAVYKTTDNVTLNSPSLVALMSCIERDPVVRALASITQNNNKFTYELTNPLCNLTRGDPVCGKCAHSRNSCHYGGLTGNQGAMAVDYNWIVGKTVTYVIATRAIVGSKSDSRCAASREDTVGLLCRTATGEEGLFDELYRAMAKNKCPYTLLYFEGNHQHVSTVDCTSDNKNSAKGRGAPATP